MLKVQPYAHNPRKNGLESAPSDDENDQESWTNDQRPSISSPNPLFPVKLCYGAPLDSNRSTSHTRIGPCKPSHRISCCKKHGIRYKNRDANQSQTQTPPETECSRIYDKNDEDWDQINENSKYLSPKCRPNRKY